MNEARTREILLLIESGAVHWKTRGGRVAPDYYTGSIVEGTYHGVDGMEKLSERLWHRVGFEDSQEGPVALSAAGEKLVAELDNREPPKSVWS